MVSNATIDTLNYVVDVQNEYNIKVFLLTVLFIYSAVLLFFSFKWEADELYKKFAKIFIMQVPSVIFLFFFPFFSIFLFRTVSWEVLYSFMIAYFSYLFVVILVAGKLGGFTLLANLIGFDTSIKKMEMKNK